MNNEHFTLDDEALSKDFGFVAESETSLLAPSTTEIEDLKKRLQAVRKIYLPLLEKLLENSDQPIIRWPNRKTLLEQQIDKLKKLTEPGF